ncbi:hypothetical protein LJC63_12295, partial [Ruminococcaceae bacterium OttesenSCG-928-L11]|nr:hypothetical protein [Ruminococcaceae bacterium OttesenSCG-928-L11]
ETSASEEATPEEEEENNPLKDLIKNQYEDLEITAAVLLRRAILPGSSIPVTVAITNNGDKTIFYTQGSGVFETPQALRTQFDGLQVVLPKDHLGIATMDFVTKELAPGESLEFVVNVLAIEPNEQFASYTYETYNEDEIYIADMEWPDLQEKYPDLTAAAAGSYTGTVNFLYTLPAEDGAADPFSGATGYAQAEVTIGVTE